MTDIQDHDEKPGIADRISGAVRGVAGRVAGATLGLAIVVTWWISGPDDPWSSRVGLAATLWAASLVLPLYLLGSEENARAYAELRGLREQVNDSALSLPASQSREEFAANMSKYGDYVQALRAKFPMPTTAISYIARDGEGQGNAPVIIETRRGYRYSVWKGRKAGYFSVSRIAEP